MNLQFKPTKVEIDGRDYQLDRLLGLSNSEFSSGIAVFLSGPSYYFSGFDPFVCKFMPLTIKTCRLASTVLTLFESSLAPYFRDCANTREGAGGAVKPAISKIARFLMVQEESVIADPPFTFSSIDGSEKPYTFALIEADRNKSIAKLYIDKQQTVKYAGTSLRLSYLLYWRRESCEPVVVNGAPIKGHSFDGGFSITIESPVVANLDSRDVGVFESKGVHPVELARYLMTIEDCGVTDVQIEGEGYKGDFYFYVLTVIEGFELSDALSVGDVGFTSNEDDVPIMPAEFSSPSSYCFSWTYEAAHDYATAQRGGLDRIRRAATILEFYCCIERFPKSVSNEQCQVEWDISSPYVPVEMGSKVYIENLDLGGHIYSGGKGDVRRHFVKVNNFLIPSSENWERLLAPNNLNWVPHYLNEAMRWAVRSRFEATYEDRVIALNTSLEFCVNEEQGETVLFEILKDKASVEFSRDEADALIQEAITKFSISEIPGLSEKEMVQLNKRLRGQLGQSLKCSRFASRLVCMVHRLGDPISKDEIDLLLRVNKARNGLLHGNNRKKVKLNMTELDQALAAATALITSKVERCVAER